MQGLLLQQQRDTDAAQPFLIRLVGEDDVLEIIQTAQLRSDGAALREIRRRTDVGHLQVISTARGKQ
ncbi:hypothetical protein [Deinococcus arboris]|uniref:hypothetical protein n=1 Tax=Deinococcus arboris TaxID=2682977 RepID=UPI0034E203BD